MSLIHILDKRTDGIIGTLNSDKGELTEAKRIDALSNQNTLDFIALNKFEFLQKRNRLLLQDTDGFFFEFIINYADQNKRTQKIIRSDASFVDLAKVKVIEPQILQGATATTATDTALMGTEWKRGIIDYAGILTINIEEYTNPLALLKLIASQFNLQLRFRIEIENGNQIVRYVDLISPNNTFEGKEIVFGKDLIGIRRKEDSSQIVTALLGIGPEREDGTRLTVLVEDLEALQRWGRNGQHLIEVYEPQSTNQDMMESELRTYTENELKKRVDAIVSYECTAASIEHIFGHSHEKIRKGQTVRIKDDGYTPPLYVEARIEEVETDPISKRVLNFKIGNFIEYRKDDLQKQILSLKNLMSDRLAKLVMASISSSAGDVFKNGLGSTVLTAKTFLGGVEIDNDGSKYSYKWSKRDKDGNLVTFSKTGKSITVSSSEVTEKATFIIEIAINDKTSQVAQITLSNVFDGVDGEIGPEGPKGEEGLSSYTHIAYANNTDGTSGFSVIDSSNKLYIGFYVDSIKDASTDPSKYKWTLIKGQKGDQGVPGPTGEDGLTPYFHTAYATNSTGTTGFSTTDATGKQYIGTYTDFVESDSTDPTKYTWVLFKGDKGDKGETGATGKGVSAITEYYLATSSSSGVTTSTSGWTTSVQEITSTIKYLWNYEKITYTDGTTSTTTPVIIGVYGDTGSTGATGKGISSVTEYYLATSASSGVTTSTSGWSTSMQVTTTTNKYLWNYEKITYTNNTTLIINPVIIGTHGATGATGSAGRDGIVNAVRRIRYIRDWINGSSANTGNHWVEIRAIAGNVNRAKGKVPTASSSTTNLSYVTDENISSSYYAGGETGLQYVQIDLGSIYDDIDYIQTWHYYADGRTYNNTKVEVSEDGINWIVLFDSTITGKYQETSRGLTVLSNPKIISAITALQLNVDKLSAITADLGSVNAGDIKGVTMNLAGGKFIVDSSGNVTFKGDLSGATGSFKGSLETSKLIVGELDANAAVHQNGQGTMISLKNAVRITDGVYGWTTPFDIYTSNGDVFIVGPSPTVMTDNWFFHKDATVSGTLSILGALVMNNNTSLFHKNTAGTNYRSITRGTDNWLHINPDSYGRTKVWGTLDISGALNVAGAKNATLYM